MRKFWLATAALVLSFTLALCACGGKKPQKNYTLALAESKTFVLDIGADVDFTEYFTIQDGSGNSVPVQADMLDLSKVDTSKEGTFTVTLNYGGKSFAVVFTVAAPSNPDPDHTTDPTTDPTTGSEEDRLEDVLDALADETDYNFAVRTQYYDEKGVVYYEDYYEYFGEDMLNTYDWYEDDTFIATVTDYVICDSATDIFYYYEDNADGTYNRYDEESYDFYYLISEWDILDFAALADFSYEYKNGSYFAKSPNNAGNAVIGEYDGYKWTRFSLEIKDGKLVRIEGTQNDGYGMIFTLSKHGNVSFSAPTNFVDGSTGGDGDGEVMPAQTYNPSSFDNDTLQDKLLITDEAIGLPSTGNISALVIPVKFTDTTVSEEQLNKLNIAFNGTAEETGWESVKSYYEKTSYGALHLSFDIQETFNAKYSSSYYNRYSKQYVEDGQTYTQTGEEVILIEALAYYESKLDLTKYDVNGDGCIDAVYLIYSAPVDYDDDDSIYWAFTTWYYGEEDYDGLWAYAYLFAGFDFMDEESGAGVKVNAETYIHETGHLLGLDDYYDYDDSVGCNEGLGNADMMDANIGDHGAYSKIMLGWLTPEIVTSTETVTLKSLQSDASCVLIPLDFNNSYFCEYLLVDLYAAEGLNALHAAVEDSYLYDGAAYGVRIYHVTSFATDPYECNDWGSFTDCNNTDTDIALIKLIEADGENGFLSSDGNAMACDLWQAGDVFNEVYPDYTRNDGKLINFNIVINSVSATEASITITYQS